LTGRPCVVNYVVQTLNQVAFAHRFETQPAAVSCVPGVG
jgi:hypothetical protein